jgi:large subunit ribosomal protein L10
VLLTRAQKREHVTELKRKLKKAMCVYVADYRGLDVPSVNALRARIRSEGQGQYEYRVAKNTLLRRASAGTDVAKIVEHLEGPTAIALGFDDPVGLAKILSEFAKDHEVFELKAGVLDGDAVTPTEIGVLATLPSLDALRSQLIGLIQAPATKLARLVAEPGAGLARLIEARRGQLESEGAG